MEILIKTIYFFLSLSLLVAIHEFGHFIAARIFKIRVEKFYIFFDPWFSLFKFKRGETEYGVGWVPLGGYVKIAGMIDESMDKEQMKLPPKPDEFRSKPAWQRFFVLIAGVTMNLLLAFVIYCGICYTYGTSYLANEDMQWGYNFNDAGKALGFADGDRIATIDGEAVDNIATIMTKLVLAESDVQVGIVRNGLPRQLTLSYDSLNTLRSDEKAYEGLYVPRMPFIIDSVASPAAAVAGLRHGDRIVGIDGEREEDFLKYDSLLKLHASGNVLLAVERGDSICNIDVPVNGEGKIGVTVLNPYQPRTQHYTLLQSIPQGAKLTAKVVGNYWQQLKLIVKPDTGLYKQVGGFIAIANIFPAEWDWFRFWNMTAFLSIILAVMNIIPIPGLDGGHTLFTLWEMITRRRPSDRFLEVAQYVGLVLILALLLFANGNDIFRFIIK
ncbi:MAG: RIP metalloprotease RseP [Alistipes sp.]